MLISLAIWIGYDNESHNSIVNFNLGWGILFADAESKIVFQRAQNNKAIYTPTTITEGLDQKKKILKERKEKN